MLIKDKLQVNKYVKQKRIHKDIKQLLCHNIGTLQRVIETFRSLHSNMGLENFQLF